MEPEEPFLTDAMVDLVEKFAEKEGLSTQEFVEQTLVNRLEKLKKIYPDKQKS